MYIRYTVKTALNGCQMSTKELLQNVIKPYVHAEFETYFATINCPAMRAEWSTEYLLDYGGKQEFYIQRLDTAFER